MFVRVASFCSLLVALSTSVGVAAQPSSPLSNTTDSTATIPLHLLANREDNGSLPGFVARRIQKDLGRRLNVPFQDLAVIEANYQVWPDACLGVTTLEESCAEGDVRGWEVTVNSAQALWTYRSDRAAQRLYLMSDSTTEFAREDFSVAIAQKVLKTASRQVQEPIDNLQVLSVQSATWDGCLGVAAPDQACTQNVVPGFRVIVGSEPRAMGYPRIPESSDAQRVQKEWVYHVSEDGSQIVQNAAASNAKPLVDTQLILPTTQIPEPGAEVFKLVHYPLVPGIRGITTLTADGTVYYEVVYDADLGYDNTKEVRYQISPEEVAEFRTLLKQQQFSNFDQLYYSNEDPDLIPIVRGSIIITAAGTSVGFTTTEKELPALLQPVVSAVLDIVKEVE